MTICHGLKGEIKLRRTSTSDRSFEYFTDNQKDAARQTDMIDFLNKYEGFTFKKVGREYHSHEHNSLVVKADRNQWYWNSQKLGGNNAITYLMKIHNKDYRDAMNILVGKGEERSPQYKQAAPQPVEETQRVLVLPESSKNQYKQAYAYLCQTRQLDREVVSDMVQQKKLYQDVKGNVVFVGFDDSNEAKFACRRGTYSYSEKQFRGDCSGSDKRYAFRMDGKDKTSVFVFEAPIDAMSHATLFNELAGDKEAYKQHTRQCLSGSADVSLEHYLSTHADVKTIYFCLDNDKTGRDSTEKYMKKYSEKGFTVSDCPPVSKDYNQDLVTYKQSVQEVKQAQQSSRNR